MIIRLPLRPISREILPTEATYYLFVKIYLIEVSLIPTLWKVEKISLQITLSIFYLDHRMAIIYFALCASPLILTLSTAHTTSSITTTITATTSTTTTKFLSHFTSKFSALQVLLRLLAPTCAHFYNGVPIDSRTAGVRCSMET